MSTPKKVAPAPKNKANASAPAGTATEALRVVPKRAGFRRAGFAFPEEGMSIPLSELTVEQLEQLENEPMLVTHRVEGNAPAVPADPEQPAA